MEPATFARTAHSRGMAEKRADPADGGAYTLEDFSAYYTVKYEKAETAEYWETCKPVKGPSKPADFRRQAAGL